MRSLDETWVEVATCAGRRDVVPRQIAYAGVQAAEVAGSAARKGNDLGILCSYEMEDGGGRAEVDVRSRLMMGFGVEGATCKSPASICVMGPSFLGRQAAAAESHCLLTSGRLHPKTKLIHYSSRWGFTLAGSFHRAPAQRPVVLNSILVRGTRYSMLAFKAETTSPADHLGTRAASWPLHSTETAWDTTFLRTSSGKQDQWC